MNKLEHQKLLYEHPWFGSDINELLTEEEFVAVCNGTGYRNWDDDYYCIIEQQLGERLEEVQ